MATFNIALLWLVYHSLCVTSVHVGEQPWTWTHFLYSPASRTIPPQSIYMIWPNATTTHGNVSTTLFMQAGSHVTVDFGVEVGGHVSFDLVTISNTSTPLSLAFAESPSFVRNISDDTGTVPTENYDLALNISGPFIAGESTRYITPKDSFRGGFRFLTFNALSNIEISNILCEIGFAPNMVDLRDYSGFFYTPDKEHELLNRMFYAGAYTVQTNIAPQDTGRFLPQVKPGWDYNASLGVGDGPFLVDGAKRDRAIWPGDLGISGPTAAIALGKYGLEAWNNSLATLFYYQNTSTGEFPFAGPDTASFRSGSQSDTYHAWSLIAMYDYAMYSGDSTWLTIHLSNITRGIAYTLSQFDPTTGLQNQTQPNDWGRQGGGDFNSALNALNYHVLTSWASLSQVNSSQGATWLAAASRLKQSYNHLLWDGTSHLYLDNTTTTTLHPQDGNALALLFNLTTSPSQSQALSLALTQNWNAIGPVTPELPDTISPFISGLEVLAHFHAGQPSRALDLMVRLWGYLLNTPSLMTGRTLVEGITANGSLYYRSTAGYDYDASYTSLSHGWSSAPTRALVQELLGLRLTSLGGRRWVLAPQLAGLDGVAGGFETGLGRFEAAIEVLPDASLQIRLQTPVGTSGVIESMWNGSSIIWVDGKECLGTCRVDGGNTTIRIS